MKQGKGNSESSSPGRGLMGDVRRIKAGSAATAEELREFIENFKGRSPHEVLGLVAQSGLTRSVALATVGCAVLLGICTVGPYSWDKAFATPAAKAAPAAATGAGPSTASPDATAADQSTAASKDKTPATGGGEPAANDALLDKLGEGETKTSDPGANPLEDAADDLLKDLK